MAYSVCHAPLEFKCDATEILAIKKSDFLKPLVRFQVI